METCQGCGFNEEDCMCETTNEADDAMPSDYEACGDCGFDHGYEYEEAAKWHEENPGSYRGLGIEDDEVILPSEDELEDIEMGELEVQDALERKNRQFDVDESDELDEDGAVGYVATGTNESDEFDDDMLPDACEHCGGKIVGGMCTNCGKETSKYDDLDEATELNPKTQSDDIKSRLAKGQKCTMEVKPENLKAAEEKLAKLPAQIRKLITLKVIDENKELDESFSRHMDAIVLRESRQVEKQPDSPYRNLAKSRKDALGRTVMRVLR